MTEETTTTVLEMLRDILASQQRIELSVADVNVRMSAIEMLGGQILACQGQAVTLMGGAPSPRVDRYDRFERRMHRFDERLDRIERRLDPVGA